MVRISRNAYKVETVIGSGRNAFSLEKVPTILPLICVCSFSFFERLKLIFERLFTPEVVTFQGNPCVLQGFTDGGFHPMGI